MKRQLLIDANNLLYRSFWVASNYGPGKGDNAEVAVFLTALKSYVRDHQRGGFNDIVCVWDKRLAPPGQRRNFRREVATTEYKGGRDTEKFDEVYRNFDVLNDLLSKLGVNVVYPYRMEADDLIAWYTTREGYQTLIVSADKDMLQLIDENTEVFNPMSKKYFDLSNFEKHTGLKTPEHYFWCRCFTGDKSDNIDGIPRVGVKTFIKIFDRDIGDYNPPRTSKLIDEFKISDTEKSIITTNYILMNLRSGYTVYKEEVEHYTPQRDKSPQPNFSAFIELYDTIKKNNGGVSAWKPYFTKNNIESVINKLYESTSSINS